MEICQFKPEIDKLNRRMTVERSLDDFLKKCLKGGIGIESNHTATKDLLKLYLSVVRSRNKVRRNWHPEQARACDELTLALITKNEFKKSTEKILQDALVATTNGTRVILETAIRELSQELADAAYKRKIKDRRSSPLKEIVKKIHRSNPAVTNTDVINEMRSDPSKYSIVNMDDKYVEIELPLGIGKDSKIIRRSLRSIGTILTDINSL